MTEISISENFLEEYLPRATIEILPPLPCDNFYLPDSGRNVTSVHQGLSPAGAGEEPGYELRVNSVRSKDGTRPVPILKRARQEDKCKRAVSCWKKSGTVPSASRTVPKTL